jgi:iron complex outermembrane receptor protein
VSKNNIKLDFFSTGALVGDSDIKGKVLKNTVATYLLTGSYKLNEDTTLYSRIASGFRPAQGNLPIIDPFTGADIAPPIVFADMAWSYETGVKGQSEDKTFSYDVALWKIDWDNFQSTVAINGVSTGGNAAGGLSAYGMEGSLNYNPTSSFTLTTNLSYTNSTLNEDEPSFSGTKGEIIPLIAKWKGSFRFNYNFVVGGDWSGNFGGGLRYTGSSKSSYVASITQASKIIGSRTLADLSFGFTNGNVNVGLYAINLFDNRALLNRSDPLVQGIVTASQGQFERPRTIGINLRYTY